MRYHCVKRQALDPPNNNNNLHRLVRILYRIRNPHCRQRTGSPALIMLRAPQSPQRYSTPRGTPTGAAAAVAVAGAPAGEDMLITIIIHNCSYVLEYVVASRSNAKARDRSVVEWRRINHEKRWVCAFETTVHVYLWFTSITTTSRTTC